MKFSIGASGLAFGLAFFGIGGPNGALAQGSLSPPGAPAATMKTLQQVEPRTPISSLPFTITNAGAYYLTTNVFGTTGFDGITIQANNVTLDLGGFALIGDGVGLKGVLVSGGRQSIAIVNGTIGGWLVAGVDARSARQTHCHGLRITGNTADGLLAGPESLVESCTAVGNSGVGIGALDSSRVVGCIADGNATGILATGTGNRIEDNLAGTNSAAGFQLTGTENLLVRNVGRYNGTNFNVGTQNAYGQILLNPSGVLSNNNPWLNFEFRFCTAEVCNGLDEDCNGVADNGNPGGGGACNTGNLGVCAAGTFTCTNGAVACVQNVQPSVEVCDGLDNNCSGAVDEGNPGGGLACTTGMPGICAAGTTACVSGALVCNANVLPGTVVETCNGLDDNCDGLTDNGSLCGSGLTCTGGVCVAATANGGACTFSGQCISGNCVDGVCCNTACAGICQACNNAGSVGTCSNIPNGQDPANECAGSGTCNGSGACALANGAACTINSQCTSGFCVDGFCCNTACLGVCQACSATKKGSGANGTCGSIAINTDPDNECSGGFGFCNGAGACF